MANQRTTFGKRQREQTRKDKLRAKQERLAVRRAEARVVKESTGGAGPPVEVVTPTDGADVAPPNPVGLVARKDP